MVQISFFNLIILLLRHSLIWQVGALQSQLPCPSDVFSPQHFLLSDIIRYSRSTCTYPTQFQKSTIFLKNPTFFQQGMVVEIKIWGIIYGQSYYGQRDLCFLALSTSNRKSMHIHACKCSYRHKHLKIKIHRHAHIHVIKFYLAVLGLRCTQDLQSLSRLARFLVAPCKLLAAACRIQFPNQRSNLGSLLWKLVVLATGPLEKSPHIFFKISSVHTDAYNSNSCLEFFLSLPQFIFVWLFITEKILVSNKILCIHLLNPMTHLKQFQNFASTTTINKITKMS